MKKNRPTAPRTLPPPLVKPKAESVVKLQQEINSQAIMNKLEPKISIITSIYNGNLSYFKEAAYSVFNQTYKNFEWCICGDGITDKSIAMYLIQLQIQENVKIKFLDKNVGIALAGNKAVEISTGEILVFFDYDDQLHPEALSSIVEVFNAYDMDIVYTDETMNRMDGKIGADHLKPNFSPHYLLSANYICHLLSVKKELFNHIGGYRPGFDGAQDHDLILRLTHESKKIFHIPKVLYSWRLHDSSFSSKENELTTSIKNGIKAVSDELTRKGLTAVVESSGGTSHYTQKINITNDFNVNIVIVSIDVKRTIICVDSILSKTNYDNYDIVIVSTDTKELKETYDDYSTVKIIQYKDKDINLPKMLNIGIGSIFGEYIILVHDDISIINQNWIQTLIGYLQDPTVGVVGGKILDKENNILEFGNIIGLNGIPVSSMFKGLNKDDSGNFRRALLTQNTSAISATMMAFRRDSFNTVNRLDENFNLYYFDFDLCLRMKDHGLFNVITPDCQIIHECDDNIVNIDEVYYTRSIFSDEKLFISKYKHIFESGDSYYNINFKQSLNSEIIAADLLDKVSPDIISSKKSIEGLVSFIVPWFNQIPIAIQSLLAQTYKNIEIIVIYDGIPSKNEIDYIKSLGDPRILFYNTPIRYNDWGHTPRNYGFIYVSNNSKAVVFTGVDNYYLPTFTEELYSPIFLEKNTIATYCNMLHDKKSWNEINSKLEFTKIDCGCFMLSTEAANEFKFGTKVSWEDWVFIEKVIKKYGSDNIVKIPRMLYIHN